VAVARIEIHYPFDDPRDEVAYQFFPASGIHVGVRRPVSHLVATLTREGDQTPLFVGAPFKPPGPPHRWNFIFQGVPDGHYTLHVWDPTRPELSATARFRVQQREPTHDVVTIWVPPQGMSESMPTWVESSFIATGTALRDLQRVRMTGADGAYTDGTITQPPAGGGYWSASFNISTGTNLFTIRATPVATAQDPNPQSDEHTWIYVNGRPGP
jgi:hypothetical protein